MAEETTTNPMTTAKEEAKRFNQAHKVGASVVVMVAGLQHKTTTRGAAYVQGDATAVVAVHGFQNVFSLSSVSDPA